MESELIEELLARYLSLLHEYTELRGQLSTHQSSMFGHLARANFAAERGLRYGPDHFDSRMKALARLRTTKNSQCADMTALFATVRPKKELTVDSAKIDDCGCDENDGNEDDDERKKHGHEKADDVARKERVDSAKKTKQEPDGLRDPLQWFGVLTPMALRQAQMEAITTIDSIIPRLASVNAEMTAVEIEVRRARKKRARSVAARVLEKQCTTDTKKTEETTSV
ncbi:hypothetical protein SEPCBS57363_004348 [Sporothrix epigloea]|uniref:Vacuolar ATPase assembly protein VMA22 n=1 Tax=Sporothrix epigloea TaxID=1892477 RepID=A0ABP0DTC7_9PEZI